MPISTTDPRELVARIFGEHLSTDEQMTLSAWADRYRMLSSKGSAEPGRWRTDRTPYLREIMDALAPSSPVRDIWFQKGAQIGATELGINFIGYVMDVCPGPMLFVQPTLDLAKRATKQRLDPLIDETPRLKDRLPPRRSKDGGNSLFEKNFAGGILIMAGANSAASLRSMPARYLFLDEVDGYPGDIDGEGDPVQLASTRTSTFRNRKCLYVSTPTVRGASRIEAGYLETDQRKYYVPCPHCGEMQVIEWARIHWDKEEPARPAWLECIACERHIEEREKTRMLAGGEWRATAPEGVPRTLRGYHLSSLYAPLGWLSWSSIRDEFLKAKEDPSRLKTWRNTKLGETWAERGDAPPWRRLYGRREAYKIGTVPMGGLLLTGAVDVQKDRLEVEIRAWGPRFESWSVEYIVLPGDTAEMDRADSPWARLDELLAHRWPHESGAELPLRILAVDSGYQTQTVYAWCRRHDRARVVPVKGSQHLATIVSQPSSVDVTYAGRRWAKGIRLWPVGSSVGKSELYAWLRRDPPAEGEQVPTGWVHFPEYPEEYFRQLTAEELVTKTTRTGHSRHEWVKTRGQNEALDLAVYNRAAASIAGIDRFKPQHWRKLAAAAGIDYGLITGAVRRPRPVEQHTEEVGSAIGALAEALHEIAHAASPAVVDTLLAPPPEPPAAAPELLEEPEAPPSDPTSHPRAPAVPERPRQRKKKRKASSLW